MKFYIGWEPREAKAAELCKYTIKKYSNDIDVDFIRQPNVRRDGLFKRDFRWVGNQGYDVSDGKPFSTEFSFTRFLTPFLGKRDGVSDWAVFVDCDFVFTDNVYNMELDPQYALMCVKHDFQPPPQYKMDAQRQEPYPRKNWSSLMAFNLNHPANERLTLDDVNTRPGYWLHGLNWLQDSEIGGLPERWNYLAKAEGDVTKEIKGAIHYTWGMPWMPGYENSEGADIFWKEMGKYACGA